MKIFILITLCALASCTLQKSKFSGAAVTERSSDAANSFCQNFSMDNKQVMEFFSKSHEISAAELHDNFDYLPCHVKGSITPKDTLLHNCNFDIQAGGTAQVSCGEDWIKFYACKNCQHLFKD